MTSHPPDPHRVVIYGGSIHLMAIEAGLAAMPGVEVVRLDPHLSDAMARIVALAPDVVIVERGDDHAGQVRMLLSQGLPLMELDASRSAVTVLSGRQVQLSGMEDLARIVKQIAATE